MGACDELVLPLCYLLNCSICPTNALLWQYWAVAMATIFSLKKHHNFKCIFRKMAAGSRVTTYATWCRKTYIFQMCNQTRGCSYDLEAFQGQSWWIFCNFSLKNTAFFIPVPSLWRYYRLQNTMLFKFFVNHYLCQR